MTEAPLTTETVNRTLEVVYRWPDGREEVRYRRQEGTQEAKNFISRIERMRLEFGDECPYFYRLVS